MRDAGIWRVSWTGAGRGDMPLRKAPLDFKSLVPAARESRASPGNVKQPAYFHAQAVQVTAGLRADPERVEE